MPKWQAIRRLPLPKKAWECTTARSRCLSATDNTSTGSGILQSIARTGCGHISISWTHSDCREPIAAGAEIPQPVIQKAQQVLESGNTPMQSCQSVYNQGCCGLSSTYCSTYFPCSRLNGVDKGNCTWYVCYQYGAIPFRGNAGTWWGQVPTYASWRRGTRPQRGLANIAWWGGDPGHVAYVGDYQGGEQVTISEMSWCNSCGRTRTIPVTDPWGYIWRASRAHEKGEEAREFRPVDRVIRAVTIQPHPSPSRRGGGEEPVGRSRPERPRLVGLARSAAGGVRKAK